ncbi:MAG: glycosyltransferase [Bacteroidales bacterium]|nr:glycosyltransferase [Bacteroidales bacterium]
MDKPLVTVSIITYNSAGTVIETLDSIYAQTYPDIELIISDDYSSDETVNLCRNWVMKNGSRFQACKILESARNTGITANCNRAIADANGRFLKLLAGDDLLEPYAVSEYVRYMLDNPQSVYVFSKVTVFGNNPDAIRLFTDTIFDYSFFNLGKKEQYEWLIGHWFQPIPAASAFVSIENAKNAGVYYFDERIPMLEDWPKWILLSQKGIDFCFIDKPLVRYRVTDNSVCSGERYKDSFIKSRTLLYRYCQFKPTIKLFGLRRAVFLYIKNMAKSTNHPFWTTLFRISSYFLRVRK